MLSDAQALEQAGAFAIVLETIPVQLSRLVSERLSVPTIGIGAGPYCDGQVQVVHDMLGLYSDFAPKHAKRYVEVGDIARDALRRYVDDVGTRRFPTEAHSFGVKEDALAELFMLGIPRR